MLKVCPKKNISEITSEAGKGFFESGLEYNPPARGVWNIVHTGMLIPEAHQIFVCARGCLRGVILTAAEMHAADRLSWVSVEEENMYDGTLESDVVDGVSEIIDGLEKRPRAVLVFLSCIHLFAGCDFEAALDELRGRYPDIDFTDCYMTPTMRTTVSPDVKMRIQLYSLLEKREVNKRAVGILGNDIPLEEESELVRIIKDNGFELKTIHNCKNYDQYKALSECFLNITFLPAAKLSGEILSKRLETEHLYLPSCFDFDELDSNYKTLCEKLDVDFSGVEKERKAAKQALKKAFSVVGDTPIAIDFAAFARVFGLARLLLEHGFNVKYIVAASAEQEDHEDFCYIKEKYPDIEIYSPVNVNMLYMPQTEKGNVLAVGQKAAYYFATDNFVNIVSEGGLYGYHGIVRFCEMLTDAFLNKKDRKRIIQHKGFGCDSCIDEV